MVESNLKIIDEAWLNIDVDESEIFNPMSVLSFREEDFHLKLSWLMTRP